MSTLSEKQQRDVLAKSIQILTDIVGKKPRGWTAPAWSTSKEIVGLLEEFGIVRLLRHCYTFSYAHKMQEYDHSFMHHDSQPYYLPNPALSTHTETDISKDASHWMHPMTTLKPSNIVEIPANWHLDDWPPFQLSLSQPSTHGFVDTAVIERLWKEQFEFHYRECPENGSFVFPISIHPQVSGKPQVIMLHERLIEWINNHEGVEWITMEQIVDEFKSGILAGVTVEGGADI